jgi:hypothetical protein
MKRLLNWLVTVFALTLMSSYAWNHWRPIANAVAIPATGEGDTEKTYDEVREAQRTVGIAGPLANYMTHQEQAKVETLQPVSHQPTAFDRVGDSVVGTSSPILHQTFAVANIVNLPFQVPAHAATPQLHGSYRSFVKPAGGKPGETESNDAANVEFLVLNETQYAEFLNGHDSEAMFSADDAHDQEVNASLPPTINQPAKYFLVFRNSSPKAGKKIVQADFRVNF